MFFLLPIFMLVTVVILLLLKIINVCLRIIYPNLFVCLVNISKNFDSPKFK